jgi:hypothetical protein
VLLANIPKFISGKYLFYNYTTLGSTSSSIIPSAPLLLPHSNSEECVIGGYKVPRDTSQCLG